MIDVGAAKASLNSQCNTIITDLNSAYNDLSATSDVNMVNGVDLNATIRSKIDSIMSDCNAQLLSLQKAIQDAIDAVRAEEEAEERRRLEAEALARASERPSKWSSQRKKEAQILINRDK